MATFDGVNKQITVTQANIDMRELYSDWKRWAALDENLKYLQAFRPVGGDTLGADKSAPNFFFLMNNWKKVVDGVVATFNINLYCDELTNDNYVPFIYINGGHSNNELATTPILKVASGLSTEEHNKLLDIPTASDTASSVWSSTTRDLTVQTGLTVEEHNKVLSLENYDDSDLPDDIWSRSTRTLTSQTGLTTEEHDKLLAVSSDVWSNSSRTLTSSSAPTSQEIWEYTTRELTTATGGMTEAELHAGLDSYSNKNNYKADVSGISTLQTSINALNDFDPANDTVARVTLVDTTTTNTDMRGTDDVSTLTASGIHSALDSYTNKDDYKDGAVDLSTVTTKVDNVQTSVNALNDFDPTNDVVAHVTLVDTTTTNTDMRGTDNVNPLTSSTLHTALDEYAHKGDWKAEDIDMSVTNGKIDDLSTQVTTAESSIKTHVTTETDTLATVSSITSLRSVVDDINTDMDALDENNVNSIYEKLLEVRADIAAAKTAGTYKAYD